HQHVAPLLVLLRLPLDQLLALTQGDDAGNLDWLEDAVVVVTLDRGQGPHHFGIPRTEAEPPAGHVVPLAHRRRLDADLLGPRGTEEAGRPVAVETNVAISEVVQDHEAEFPCQGYHINEEVALDDRRARVMRVIEDEDLWPGVQMLSDDGH